MNKPLVSVVIPVKNGASLIGETIRSVLNQSYSNLEVIVINDHSDDHTYAYVSDMSKKDSRLILIDNQTEKRGAPACRNIGYKRSSGKYVIFLDADDLLSNNCIENRVNQIESNPECDFFVFQCELFKVVPGDIGINCNPFSTEDDLDRFVNSDAPWHTAGPIWKKSAIITLGGWDESVKIFQDWEFHIRALIANLIYKKEYIVDFYYRRDVNQSISSQWHTFDMTVYFSELFKKFYIYLLNARKLTTKRKEYIFYSFFRTAIFALRNFNDVNLAINILKNAKQVNLINSFSVYFMSYMLFLFTRKSYISNKIGWYTLRGHLLKSSNKYHQQDSDDLLKQ